MPHQVPTRGHRHACGACLTGRYPRRLARYTGGWGGWALSGDRRQAYGDPPSPFGGGRDLHTQHADDHGPYRGRRRVHLSRSGHLTTKIAGHAPGSYGDEMPLRGEYRWHATTTSQLPERVYTRYWPASPRAIGHVWCILAAAIAVWGSARRSWCDLRRALQGWAIGGNGASFECISFTARGTRMGLKSSKHVCGPIPGP